MVDKILTCDELGIPKHLHRHNRQVDPNFDKKEYLYRRIPPGELLANGQISASSLRIHKMSVNRGKYTKFPKKDVLYNIKSNEHFFTWGIVKINVGFLERLKFDHPKKENHIYTLKVIHEPEECMYPHSIIEILLNGKTSNYDMPKSRRSLFRDKFITNCIIVKKPDTSFFQ